MPMTLTLLSSSTTTNETDGNKQPILDLHPPRNHHHNQPTLMTGKITPTKMTLNRNTKQNHHCLTFSRMMQKKRTSLDPTNKSNLSPWVRLGKALAHGRAKCYPDKYGCVGVGRMFGVRVRVRSTVRIDDLTDNQIGHSYRHR